MRAWATHTKERYPDSASTWSWELWNEPNIGYWHGTAAEYHELYDYTEQALHEVFPQGVPKSAWNNLAKVGRALGSSRTYL